MHAKARERGSQTILCDIQSNWQPLEGKKTHEKIEEEKVEKRSKLHTRNKHFGHGTI